MSSGNIHWPPQYHPDVCAVHVSNHLEMAVSCEDVWTCLIRATAWPDWYPNSANVRLLNTEGDDLQLGTRFRWKTFGMTIDCVVEEFEPFERLAWSSNSFGMHVYHVWLITPRGEGCHVLTEETQNGLIPKLARALMPGKMHKFHQIWLEQLNVTA